jgi:hypothetical protein
LSLGGCGLLSSKADLALRNSPSFKAGYADGCADAQQQGSDLRNNVVRDDALYNSDKVYREGWASGYAGCRPTDPNLGNTMPGDNPMPSPVPH